MAVASIFFLFVVKLVVIIPYYERDLIIIKKDDVYIYQYKNKKEKV